MENYATFAKSSAGGFVGRKLGFDLNNQQNWDEFAASVQEIVNSATGQDLIGHLRKASTGETVLLAAALYAADYPGIANELMTDPEGGGSIFFSRFGRTDAVNRAAILCCLTRPE